MKVVGLNWSYLLLKFKEVPLDTFPGFVTVSGGSVWACSDRCSGNRSTASERASDYKSPN